MKGRGSKPPLIPRPGRLNPNAKLTKEDVAYIVASTDNSSKIARRFGVSDRVIRRVRRGEGYVAEVHSALEKAMVSK